MTVFKNWLRTSFWKQLLGKYTSPKLDPDTDLAVKIPDPAKGPDPDPQHCFRQQPYFSFSNQPEGRGIKGTQGEVEERVKQFHSRVRYC
jgi:hypothetical protein